MAESPLDIESLSVLKVNQDNPDMQEVINNLPAEQKDAVRMTPYEYGKKYGVEAADKMTQQLTFGAADYLADKNSERYASDIAADTLSSVGQGIITPITDIASMVTSSMVSPFSKNLAAGITNTNAAFKNWIAQQDSAGKKSADRAYALESALIDKNNELKYEKDLANGKSWLAANVADIGRDFASTLSHLSENPSRVGDIAANAAGSLASGGVVAAGLRKLGAVALTKAAQRKFGQAIGQATAQKAATAIDNFAWQGATGLMEGGAGYNQTIDAVLSMPIEELYQKSPVFGILVQEKMNQGMSQAEAENEVRNELAVYSGRTAGAIQGAVGLITGGLSKGLEKTVLAPTEGKLLANASKDTLKEIAEEGMQGFDEPVAQNTGINMFVDPSQRLFQGAGSNMAESMIGAGLSSGGMQVPGVVNGIIDRKLQSWFGSSNKPAKENTNNAGAGSSPGNLEETPEQKAAREKKEDDDFDENLAALNAARQEYHKYKDAEKLSDSDKEQLAELEAKYKLTDEEKKEYGIEDDNILDAYFNARATARDPNATNEQRAKAFEIYTDLDDRLQDIISPYTEQEEDTEEDDNIDLDKKSEQTPPPSSQETPPASKNETGQQQQTPTQTQQPKQEQQDESVPPVTASEEQQDDDQKGDIPPLSSSEAITEQDLFSDVPPATSADELGVDQDADSASKDQNNDNNVLKHTAAANNTSAPKQATAQPAATTQAAPKTETVKPAQESAKKTKKTREPLSKSSQEHVDKIRSLLNQVRSSASNERMRQAARRYFHQTFGSNPHFDPAAQSGKANKRASQGVLAGVISGENVPKELVQTVLDLNDKSGLSRRQMAILETYEKLFDAYQNQRKSYTSLGAKSDQTSHEIHDRKSDLAKDDDFTSLRKQFAEIASAIIQNNPDRYQKGFAKLSKWIQGQRNKLNAAVASYQQGKKLTYKTINPSTGEVVTRPIQWHRGKDGKRNEGSDRYVQNIWTDLYAMVDTYNTLGDLINDESVKFTREAYPQDIQELPLTAEFAKKKRDVKNRFVISRRPTVEGFVKRLSLNEIKQIRDFIKNALNAIKAANKTSPAIEAIKKQLEAIAASDDPTKFLYRNGSKVRDLLENHSDLSKSEMVKQLLDRYQTYLNNQLKAAGSNVQVGSVTDDKSSFNEDGSMKLSQADTNAIKAAAKEALAILQKADAGLFADMIASLTKQMEALFKDPSAISKEFKENIKFMLDADPHMTASQVVEQLVKNINDTVNPYKATQIEESENQDVDDPNDTEEEEYVDPRQQKLFKDTFWKLFDVMDKLASSALKKGFKVAKYIESKLVDKADPIKALTSFLKNPSKNHEFLKDNKNAEFLQTLLADPKVREKFSEFFSGFSEALAKQMNTDLNAKLLDPKTKKPTDKGYYTQYYKALGAKYKDATGKELSEEDFSQAFFANTGILAFVTKEPNETLKYDPYLLQMATVAFMDFLLENQGARNRATDELKAAVFGSREEGKALTENEREFLSGMSPDIAIRDIAQRIKDYLGIQSDPEVPVGLSDNLVNSLAAAMLDAAYTMSQEGKTKYINRTEIKRKSPKGEYSMYSLNVAEFAPELLGGRNLLSELVLNRPSNNYIFDTKGIKQSDTYLHNKVPGLKRTDAEKTASAKQSTEPYKADKTSTKVIFRMGVKGILAFMGLTVDDEANFNETDLASIKSRQQIYTSGMADAKESLKRQDIVAKQTGQSLWDVPRYFPNDTGKTGRAQMAPSINPVGNKLCREMFLCTWSTVDLNKPEHKYVFMKAFMQAFGIKIQNEDNFDEVSKTFNSIVETQEFKDLMKLFDKAFANQDSMDILSIQEDLGEDFGNKVRAAVKAISKASGQDLDISILGLKALIEKHNWDAAVARGDTTLETSFYIEPDGPTDGSINGSALTMTGAFTENDIIIQAFGGNLLKRGMTRTLSGIRKLLGGDGSPIYASDLYTRSGIFANIMEKAIHAALQRSKKPYEQKSARDYKRTFDLVKDLFATFVGGIERNPDGSLSYKRSFAKPPCQTVIYGAGKEAVSTNFFYSLENGLASHCSKMLREINKNPKLSLQEASKIVDPSFDFEGTINKINQLLRAPKFVLKGESTQKLTCFSFNPDFVYGISIKTAEDLRTFKFTEAQKARIIESLTVTLGETFSRVIHDSLGDRFMKNMTILTEASQLISAPFIASFQAEVKRMLNSSEAERFGLSPNQIKELYSKYKDLLPLVTSSDHNFVLFKNDGEIEDFDKKNQMVKSQRNGNWLNVTPSFRVPSEPGVIIKPYSVIGGGDASMMRNGFNDPRMHNSMNTYDGLQTAIGCAKEIARVINEANYNAVLNGNIYRDMAKLFNQMKAVIELNEGFLNSSPEVKSAFITIASRLVQEAFPNEKRVEKDNMISQKVQNMDIVSMIDEYQEMLEDMADQVDARHAVMKRHMSNNHMCGVGEGTSYYNFELDPDINNSNVYDAKAVAEELNKEYEVEYKQLSEKRKAEKNKDGTDPSLKNLSDSDITSELSKLNYDIPNYEVLATDRQHRLTGEGPAYNFKLHRWNTKNAKKVTKPSVVKKYQQERKDALQKAEELSERRRKLLGEQAKRKTASNNTVKARIRKYSVVDYLRTRAKSDKKFVEQLISKLGANEMFKYWNISFESPNLSEDQLNSADASIDIKNQTIYISKDVKPHVLLHEMVHAITAATIKDYLNGGKNISNGAKMACENLIDLMNDFLLDPPALPEGGTLDPELRADYDTFLRVMDSLKIPDTNQISPENLDTALNEFVAYTWSNPELLEQLRTRAANDSVANRFRSFIEKCRRFIKMLVFGKGYADISDTELNRSYLSQLSWSTKIIAKQTSSLTQTIRMSPMAQENSVLAHTAETVIPLIEQIRSKAGFQKYVSGLNKKLEQYANNQQFRNMCMDYAKSFAPTQEEFSSFIQTYQILDTCKKVTGARLLRLQSVIEKFFRDNPVSSFEDTRYANEKVRKQFAKAQYNWLSSGNGDKSHLAFMAAALSNKSLKDRLEKLNVPETPQSKAKGSANKYLENLGYKLLNALERWITNTGNSQDSYEIIEDLFQNLQEENARYKGLSNSIRGVTETINTAMAAVLPYTAKFSHNAAKRLNKSVANSTTQMLESLTAAVDKSLNGGGEDIFAESLMNFMNSTPKIPEFLRSLVSDMTGRTVTIASTYDRIKPTKAWVQQLRTEYRNVIPQKLKEVFQKPLTKKDSALLYKTLGKTDIGALQGYSPNNVARLYTNNKYLASEIKHKESKLNSLGNNYAAMVRRKGKQLAKYMNGQNPGNNLLMNADAVAHVLGTSLQKAVSSKVTKDMVRNVDELITLYAIQELSKEQKQRTAELFTSEPRGMYALFGTIAKNRKDEFAKAKGNVRYNAIKGYISPIKKNGYSLIRANDADKASLERQGYVTIRQCGIAADGNPKIKPRWLMLRNFAAQPIFNEGAIQTAHQTASGADIATGFLNQTSAGRSTNIDWIQHQFLGSKPMESKECKNEFGDWLRAVYNNKGEIIGLEHILAPDMFEGTVNDDPDVFTAVGVQAGRIIEEAAAQEMNKQTIQALYDQWKKAKGSSHEKEYVNVFDKKIDDSVIKDAVSLIPWALREEIEKKFGEKKFYIRRDQIADMIGQRNASVTDFWTGNSRWSPRTQKIVMKFAENLFGKKAFKYLANAEKTAMFLAASARNNIVVKSTIVPTVNGICNGYQLLSWGVGPVEMSKGAVNKSLELQRYIKMQSKIVELDMLIGANEKYPEKVQHYKTQQARYKQVMQNMSIWPLIKAGEFSTIADVGTRPEDIGLISNNIAEHFEKMVGKMPPGLKTAGEYALFTKNTALYRAVEKSVQFGDFVAKSILYDYLTKEKGYTSDNALAICKEEFVDYDKSAGRTRGYLENMGLLWFYNYKLRIMKAAIRSIRNNPFYTLMTLALPFTSPFGNLGLPITDNFFSKLISGDLGYTVGPGIALESFFKIPTVNVLT